jgi:hypothetical protein
MKMAAKYGDNCVTFFGYKGLVIIYFVRGAEEKMFQSQKIFLNPTYKNFLPIFLKQREPFFSNFNQPFCHYNNK